MSRVCPPLVRVLLAAVAGLLPAAVGAAPAGAATAQLRLGGPAANALAGAGGRIVVDGPSATTAATRVRLLAGDLVRDEGDAYVALTGELRVHAGRRHVRFTGLELQLTGYAHLSARLGDRRLALLELDRRSGAWAIGQERAVVRRAQASLTRAGARLLRQRLRRPGIRPGRLGRVSVTATAPAPAPPPVTLPADAPAGARAIAGGQVQWAPRASWLRYLSQAEGAGAAAGAAFDGTTYTLPIAAGWYDPAGGSAVVRTTGATTFRYLMRTVDLALGSWTYELTPGGGSATAVVERAVHLSDSADASLVGQRTIVMSMDLSQAPAVADDASVAWTDVPLTLAESGTKIFNAYLPGSEQGTVTIRATLAPAE